MNIAEKAELFSVPFMMIFVTKLLPKYGELLKLLPKVLVVS